MIKNERQYKISKTKARELEKALVASAICAQSEKDIHPKLRKAQLGAIKVVLADLKTEITEYEQLRTGVFNIEELSRIDSVPFMLIKARIASGMTQRDLALRLKVKEPQIQNYEATEYARASLSRIRQIAHILGKAIEPTNKSGTSRKKNPISYELLNDKHSHRMVAESY